MLTGLDYLFIALGINVAAALFLVGSGGDV